MSFSISKKRMEVGREEVTLTTLSDGVIDVVVSTLGGGLRGIYLPYEGEKRNILFRYAEEAQYLSNKTYSGAVLCPNAGRIRDGELTIKGRFYQLTKNERGVANHHGGYKCASFNNWKPLETSVSDSEVSVSMGTELPDGTDGYPGNRSIKITYTLTKEGLKVEVTAISDQDTFINLATHPYFNLNGDISTCALDNVLRINADKIVRNNRNHLPGDTVPVDGTAFDLREGSVIQDMFDKYPDDPDIVQANGYNNAFVVNPATEDKPQLSMYSKTTKLGVDINTNASCMFICSASFIHDVWLENGVFAKPSCAVAVECQDYPDSPHLLGDKMTITGPGDVFKREISYKFH